MYKKSVFVPEGIFQSKLTGIASALLAATAITGAANILSVFLPGGLLHLRENAAPEVIKTTLKALHGWLIKAPVDEQVSLTFAILLSIFVLLGTVFSAALAVGIFQMQRSKAANGAQLIVHGAKILFYVITALGISAAVLFAIRFVTYVQLYLSKGSKGIIYMLPGAATEIALGAIATLLILKLRRFFDSVGDCALSISRTLSTGILNAPTISMTPAVGCLLLGIASALIALGCAGIMTTAMFLLNGAAAILMFFYLRNFKRSSEYLLYKGTPVTTQD